MRHRIVTLISLALVVGGSVGAAIPAMAAVGKSSSPPSGPITIQSPGTLLAHGAAAAVSVKATCPSGDSVFLYNLQLTQKSGPTVVSGNGSASFACTGAPLTVPITIVAPGGGRAFTVGSAFAQATFNECSPFFDCTFGNVGETIQLKK